ncbi:MAG: hypothetical protein M1321_01680 [Candidatus Marsarchaeota archaeon]|jgi:dolichol kinase|nr:hypothetical protein [Candidatus Marsarchaeota archaeon]
MEYYIVALYAVALVLALYKLFAAKDNRDLLLFMAFLVASWLLFNYEGLSNATSVLLSGVIIFNLAASSFGRMRGNAFLIIALLYAAAALSYGAGAQALLQSAVLGAVSSPRMYRHAGRKGVHRRTENLRNMFQIAAGVFFIAVFLLLQAIYASVTLFLAFVAGMAISNVVISSKGGRIRILGALEREGAEFGHGAFWLGAGALLAAGFLSPPMAIVAFSAIFIADSFSTIAGVHLGSAKLPYNRKKSVIGTLAYFTTVLLMSFPIILYAALPVAAAAALVESLPVHLDDNFDVAAVLAIVMRIVYL